MAAFFMEGWGLAPPFFFHLGGPLSPLLWNPRSNTAVDVKRTVTEVLSQGLCVCVCFVLNRTVCWECVFRSSPVWVQTTATRCRVRDYGTRCWRCSQPSTFTSRSKTSSPGARSVMLLKKKKKVFYLLMKTESTGLNSSFVLMHFKFLILVSDICSGTIFTKFVGLQNSLYRISFWNLRFFFKCSRATVFSFMDPLQHKDDKLM